MKLKKFGKKIRIYSRALKRRTVGISYGDKWEGKDNEFYEKMHQHGHIMNKDFVSYVKNKKDIKTVLEVGCGTGIYPIKYKDLFTNLDYTGIDISKSVINYCKKNSNFEFICGDFSKMELDRQFDLVFSHGVINHVPDIDLFFSKIVSCTKKYAHIQASHGYFPDLEKHNMVWAENDGIYNSQLSVKQTKKTLLDLGLKEDEFVISPQETGSNALSTLIEITKTL